MVADHAEQVLAIYQAGMASRNATFETSMPTWTEFDASKLPGQRHAALDLSSDAIVGWVAVSATSARAVYAGVVEHSVYVHPDAQRRGVGSALLQALVCSTEAAGIWTTQSGVFPEDIASLWMHAAAGFRVIGTRERIGQRHGIWRDVVLMERRSARIQHATRPVRALGATAHPRCLGHPRRAEPGHGPGRGSRSPPG